MILNGKELSLNPSNFLDKGGEAEIYKIGQDKVLKLYKQPNHPDYAGNTEENKLNREGAKRRLRDYQRKLRNFPKDLPKKVITPIDIVTDQKGAIILGYTMRFLKNMETLSRYMELDFRNKGIANEEVRDIFLDLYETVDLVHKKNVVIGDFNYFNVMVDKNEAYLIDADSFQFGPYLTMTYIQKFLDPLHCQLTKKGMVMSKPYNPSSDWYAYLVMLFESLLFVDPFGGIYLPKDPKKKIPQDLRPIKRITALNPDVRYPKPALPFRDTLPDELMQLFFEAFSEGKRKTFSKSIIESLTWQSCSSCGTVHARDVCPNCKHQKAERKKITIRGSVTEKILFKTTGQILYATVQNKNLLWLYHEDDEYKREDGEVVIKGQLDHKIRYRLKRDATYLASNGKVVSFKKRTGTEHFSTGSYKTLPIFDANDKHIYWLNGQVLTRDDLYGPSEIGQILDNQTLFWVGPKFGFGFYIASGLNTAFVFDAEKKGINDDVKLPKFDGPFTDSTCVFTDERCWFMITILEKNKQYNYLFAILKDGTVEGMKKEEKGKGTFLSEIRGKAAYGKYLFSPTDSGIVMAEIDKGKIGVAKEFPDTEPFVDSKSNLFISREGLYVVTQKEIKSLSIS